MMAGSDLIEVYDCAVLINWSKDTDSQRVVKSFSDHKKISFRRLSELAMQFLVAWLLPLCLSHFGIS